LLKSGEPVGIEFEGAFVKHLAMAKVLKNMPTYEVIPDSNALFAIDPRKLVSGGFESALAELRRIAPVNLHIPQVVLGELAFQKWAAAEAAIRSANKNLSTLSATTGCKAPALPSPETARRCIKRRYAQWCTGVQASVLRPKIRKQEWERMVEDAVWRVSPFERSEDGKHEKGFRDRVIFESIEQFCRHAANEVIVLCQDGLLTERLKQCGAKLSVFPRLEDFASRVRLMKEQEVSAWVNELFAAANAAFYSESDPECVYTRNKVGDALLAKASDLEPPLGSIGLLSLGPKAWKRVTDEKITIVATRFQKRDNDRWKWTTELKVAAAFSGKDVLDLLHEQIRVSTFAASWSCAVSTAAEIKDARLEEISFKERQMHNDTPEERQKWSLPAKPTSFPWLDSLKVRPTSQIPSGNK